MAQREFDYGDGEREAPPGRAEVRVLQVGELLAGLRGLLEGRVGRQWVMGEVSNLHRAGSGHVYFTLTGLAPRTAEEAVLEGLKVGSAL